MNLKYMLGSIFHTVRLIKLPPKQEALLRKCYTLLSNAYWSGEEDRAMNSLAYITAHNLLDQLNSQDQVK